MVEKVKGFYLQKLMPDADMNIKLISYTAVEQIKAIIPTRKEIWNLFVQNNLLPNNR